MGGCGVEGKGEEARAGFGRLPCGRDGGGGLPCLAAPSAVKKEGVGEERKGRGGADTRDRQRSEKEE